MKIKELVLTLAIVVLTIFVTFYGINTFVSDKDYSDFCGEHTIRPSKLVETESTCFDSGGEWVYEARECVTDPCPQGWCDYYSGDAECRQEYDSFKEKRGLTVFLIAIPLGILIVIFGLGVFGLEAVGAGLMGGGIGTLLYGSGSYWQYTQDWVRFLLSLVGLVALIWFSYYVGNRKGKKK